MNCENKKIVIVFSGMIGLIVLAIISFDLGLYVKAFLGTVALGLLCFMRALMTAVEMPEDDDKTHGQLAEQLSEKRADESQSDSAQTEEKKDEDSNCMFSASSEEFLRHLKDSSSFKK